MTDKKYLVDVIDMTDMALAACEAFSLSNETRPHIDVWQEAKKYYIDCDQKTTFPRVVVVSLEKNIHSMNNAAKRGDLTTFLRASRVALDALPGYPGLPGKLLRGLPGKPPLPGKPVR